jgi:D-Tyr-tRNAtyr deacylase
MAALDFALVGRVFVEDAVHDGGAARIGQQFTLVADQAPGRRVEYEACAADAGGRRLN